jgi:bifunctional non-homologous end joining protein LigD
VRLFTRNGYDWTERFPAIATAAAALKVHGFTMDGEAVVVGPDGLSRFDELRRRASAKSAVLFALDLRTGSPIEKNRCIVPRD